MMAKKKQPAIQVNAILMQVALKNEMSATIEMSGFQNKINTSFKDNRVHY